MKGVSGVALCLAFFAGQTWAEEIANGYSLAVDEAGLIQLPKADYRAEWPVLGTWVVAGGDEVDGEAGAAGLHVTYTQPGVIEHFRATGEFPDGAILLKELFSAETAKMTTGVVSHAAELEGWFVMIKDRKRRFPDNDLWGKGWGWAYFGADAPEELVTTNYVAECQGCHVPARETDWVFIHGYPALQGHPR